MPEAGQIVRASHGITRVGTNTATTDTATFTAATQTDSVTATLVDGERYLVEFYGHFQSSTAGDDVTATLLEDSTAGTILHVMREDLPTANTSRMFYLRAEYTASASGSKTFVVTGQRAAGAGNVLRHAATSQPAYLTVTRILED